MQRGARSRRSSRSRRAISPRRSARREELGIARAYGSYEELLADPDVEAIYNPLPNHLHVPWTIRAAEAGKHVLCEKPIALSADEARQLLDVRERTGVQIGEAFMVRNHPQWLAVRELVDARQHRRPARRRRPLHLLQARSERRAQRRSNGAAAA